MIPEQHHHHHHHHPAYAQGPYKPPPPPPSPPSSPAPGKPCCGLRFCCSKPRRRCCCHCGASVNSSAFTCFGVCVLVLGYTLLGAFTFTALEGGRSGAGPSPGSVVLGEEVRARTVDKLWSITEDLNILYKDNWTRLAAQEVLKFQDTLVRNLRGGALHYPHHHHRWSFSSSFLYSLTLITTIGEFPALTIMQSAKNKITSLASENIT
ncbi:hypothetical protein C0J52_20000 [Blattella germanica]|nr:hypothetical protein C0J52_20000 [Blattella germanica]